MEGYIHTVHGTIHSRFEYWEITSSLSELTWVFASLYKALLFNDKDFITFQMNVPAVNVFSLGVQIICLFSGRVAAVGPVVHFQVIYASYVKHTCVTGQSSATSLRLFTSQHWMCSWCSLQAEAALSPIHLRCFGFSLWTSSSWYWIFSSLHFRQLGNRISCVKYVKLCWLLRGTNAQ